MLHWNKIDHTPCAVVLPAGIFGSPRALQTTIYSLPKHNNAGSWELSLRSLNSARSCYLPCIVPVRCVSASSTLQASRGPQRVVMSSAAELLGPQRSFAVRDEYSAGAQRQREASPFRQSRAYESSSLSKESGPGPDVAFAKRIQLAWNVLFPTDTPKR